MTHSGNDYEHVAQALAISPERVRRTGALLENGATVPFIARYRKEMTGSLDEVAITAIRDLLAQRAEVARRRAAIIASLEKRGLLTDQLRRRLQTGESLSVLEDMYLPYRPKRRTRAETARERGLEPLAEMLMRQENRALPASDFVDPARELNDAEQALAGARDICAEKISEDMPARSELRRLFRERAIVISRVVKKNEGRAAKFKDYFDWRQPAARLAGHRVHALFRGEAAKMLSLSIRPPDEEALFLLNRRYVKRSPHQEQMLSVVEDSYRRLLAPSLENELRAELKGRADSEAIAVFSDNLRDLLLAPPLGQKRVMALDPGFRTGSKLVCLDGQGRLLATATIYPTHGDRQRGAAGRLVRDLIESHGIEAIAIGNGTASRETEAFVRSLGLAEKIVITLVNEDGASIYSASDTARTEFPDLDITLRGAVSIGRRLQDPLAELVKIDPKSIGVGQYQHDVDQRALKNGLEAVVSSCVNSVGVELNTASIELLTSVSGLGPALAAAIASWRDENGPFASRHELLKVPRLGAKAFEQAAGFLKISGAANPLDGSAVHPERYEIVEQMARDTGTTIAALLDSPEARARVEPARYISDAVGLPTLEDILAELAKPGRDPRPQFHRFSFAEGINTIADLTPGMRLPAVITNVTTFGAFADIGVHQDGLIHVSQLADRYVKNPSEVVKVRQQVVVRVLEVDLDRARISLSMKND